MIEGSTSKSHGLGWTLLLLFAVPMIYILVFPPLAMTVMSPSSVQPPPRWLQTLGKPYQWLYENVPVVQKPIDSYSMWWMARITNPTPTYIDPPPMRDQILPRDLRTVP